VVARLTLVIGGARCGKSRYAESLVTALPPPWVYAATGQGLDAEMAARIEAHRARRGAGWRTVEVPLDLATVMTAQGTAPVLVDCLTLWLSNLMMADTQIEQEFDRLAQALAKVAAPVVLVANEVGSGIVPDNALARRFRDLQGSLNQRIAALADQVVLVVAGLPLFLKGLPTG
jgi:adenosylcobinamide kinase / adenosylcobinamide-phosphate guanylyltransferase